MHTVSFPADSQNELVSKKRTLEIDQGAETRPKTDR